jgi:hypothetical protein
MKKLKRFSGLSTIQKHESPLAMVFDSVAQSTDSNKEKFMIEEVKNK